jgi:hypothetical protein
VIRNKYDVSKIGNKNRKIVFYVTVRFQVSFRFFCSMFGTGFFCGWPKYMSLCLSPKAKASWELRKATKKSPWHNNHLPYIVKERTYLLGSTPCVRVGHGASIFFPDGVRLEPLIFGQTWRHNVTSCIKLSH